MEYGDEPGTIQRAGTRDLHAQGYNPGYFGGRLEGNTASNAPTQGEAADSALGKQRDALGKKRTASAILTGGAGLMDDEDQPATASQVLLAN